MAYLANLSFQQLLPGAFEEVTFFPMLVGVSPVADQSLMKSCAPCRYNNPKRIVCVHALRAGECLGYDVLLGVKVLLSIIEESVDLTLGMDKPSLLISHRFEDALEWA